MLLSEANDRGTICCIHRQPSGFALFILNKRGIVITEVPYQVHKLLMDPESVRPDPDALLKQIEVEVCISNLRLKIESDPA